MTDRIKPAKRRVGELLLQDGLLTRNQLRQAMEIQKTQDRYEPLGEICVGMKWFSRSVLNGFLRKHQKNILLGELLTNVGLVTEKQVEEALETQKSTHEKLGKILVQKGYLTESALISVVSFQLGVPKIIPNPALIDKSLLKGVSQSLLQTHVVLPAFKEGEVLTLIMADPLSEELLRELEGLFRCLIQPAIAPAREILEAIDRCYEVSGSKTVADGEDASGGSQDELIIGGGPLPPGEDANIVQVVHFIIVNAVADGASDIHVDPQDTCVRVRYRIDGMLHHKTDLPLNIAPNIIARIKVLCSLDSDERTKHQDGRVEARILNKEVEIRVSTYPGVHGESVLMRILHRNGTLIDFDSLGFSPANLLRVQRLISVASGVILVTGPTDSGRTMTLYASLNHLNNIGSKIITVEDQVDYTIPGVVHATLDPKTGLSSVDFIKTMMRQDPDILMVGEIRDRQEAAAVIQAALMGRKVFSTFHAEDTIGALLLLMGMGIEPFLISSTVVSVISQRLVRILCPECRKRRQPTQELLDAYHVLPGGLDSLTFYEAQGCEVCRGTGFRGRTAIHEVLEVNDTIKYGVLNRMTAAQIRIEARKTSHLVSLREDCFYKAAHGVTTLEEGLRVAVGHESDDRLSRNAEEIIRLCEEMPAPLEPARSVQ